MSLYSLIKTALLGTLIVSFTGLTNSYAQSRGGANGGGGDPTEMGVDSIRANILKWIETGRSIRFKKYPAGINNAIYAKRMKAILAPHQVVVGFVTTAQEDQTQNPEQKVFVAGNAKSCRGFVSTQDLKPHILCNSDRYPKDADEQYKLIHHEYAGLAGIEKNIGPSSDYTLSNQLSYNLISKVVRVLPINEADDALFGFDPSKTKSSGLEWNQAKCVLSYTSFETTRTLQKTIIVNLVEEVPGGKSDLVGSSEFFVKINNSYEDKGKISVSFAQAMAGNDSVAVQFQGLDVNSSGEARLSVSTGTADLKVECIN